jgi:signal transduction histidine kinase
LCSDALPCASGHPERVVDISGLSMNCARLPLILFFVPLLSACAAKDLNGDSNFMLLKLSRSWIVLDNALADYFACDEAALVESRIEAVLAAAEYFKVKLNDFSRTRLYQYYRSKFISKPRGINEIADLTNKLTGAVRNGDRKTVFETTILIRVSILDWQNFDTELLQKNIRNYFYLFVFLIVLSLGFIIFLTLMLLSLRKSRRREQETFEFSRQMIKGQEKERQRISLELHDTVLPELKRFSDMNGGAVSPKYVLAQQKLVTEKIRSICTKLFPPDFNRTALQDALFSLYDTFSKKTNIECRFSADNQIDMGNLSSENQLHCYRMVQESLNNIETHAKASEVILVLRNGKADGNKTLLICVSDDGCGIHENAKNAQKGLGMRSMRSRAAILGASLDFISERGSGTMVRIEIPL